MIANSIAQNIDRVVMAVNLGCGSWGDNSISVNVTPHHGLANALMISHVIRYNATDVPFKQAIFSQNKYCKTSLSL